MHPAACEKSRFVVGKKVLHPALLHIAFNYAPVYRTVMNSIQVFCGLFVIVRKLATFPLVPPPFIDEYVQYHYISLVERWRMDAVALVEYA
jgi:hypothetical protein